jgi:hypothetical protein
MKADEGVVPPCRFQVIRVWSPEPPVMTVVTESLRVLTQFGLRFAPCVDVEKCKFRFRNQLRTFQIMGLSQKGWALSGIVAGHVRPHSLGFSPRSAVVRKRSDRGGREPELQYELQLPQNAVFEPPSPTCMASE